MLLSARDLSARYGRIPILNGIDLQVAAGEFVGVLGHNGMGKTTLLRTLMGFVPAQRGRIVVEDVDVTREPPYARARARRRPAPAAVWVTCRRDARFSPGSAFATISGWASPAAAPTNTSSGSSRSSRGSRRSSVAAEARSVAESSSCSRLHAAWPAGRR